MPTSLSMLIDLPQSALNSRGAFDPILDLDTRLFIDPHLLKHEDIPEFRNSYISLQAHFQRISKLLSASEAINDVFWRNADKMMQWSEVKGLCIGYASKGTSGSGIGPELRRRLLSTAKAIISKGRDEPELFELVGLLEEDFGPDRISDMSANVIRDDLVTFTKRIYRELIEAGGTPLAIDTKTDLPINPFTDQPILLVPISLLRDLPVALDWSSRDIIAQHNEELRQRVNHIIGQSWKEATRGLKKGDLKEILLENPELIDDLVKQYAAKEAQKYDFVNDRAGEYIWFSISRQFVKDNPLSLLLPTHPTTDDVYKLVLSICVKFKNLVENNGLCKLFYNEDGTAKHESAIQLVFFGISDSYCQANKLLIAPESDSGRGPVDFKFGTNMENSVLVEIKKSTNTSGLKKGIEKQLPEYMNAEGSKRAVYLVVDVGSTQAAINRLSEINNKINGTAINILRVDGIPKVSASRL
ncbi:MAG: hypothetical protein Q7V56_08625 [Gammaproteobacteria bacterium]|nr:hypothetical protein [Gammaproteobacteria bacterium]